MHHCNTWRSAIFSLLAFSSIIPFKAQRSFAERDELWEDGGGGRKNKFDLNHNSNVVILCENSYECEAFFCINYLVLRHEWVNAERRISFQLQKLKWRLWKFFDDFWVWIERLMAVAWSVMFATKERRGNYVLIVNVDSNIKLNRRKK